MRPSHRKVVFPSRHAALKSIKSKLLPSSKHEIMAALDEYTVSIPAHFLASPPIQDGLATETSKAQQDTIAECLPLLNAVQDPARSPLEFNDHGVPRLVRQEHVDFLRQSLGEFPAAFVAADASRPWMVYWALMGLYLLGDDVTQYRDR
jgi:protein farnesyltransferase subunit beta